MPALRIQRKERFARLLAAGKSASEAYELAGYKRDASGANSCHLAKSDEVTNRVQELTREAFERERAVAAAAVQRTAITRQSLVEKLEATRKAAEEAGQYGAAVAASKEISVLLGIRIERSERGGGHQWPNQKAPHQPKPSLRENARHQRVFSGVGMGTRRRVLSQGTAGSVSLRQLQRRPVFAVCYAAPSAAVEPVVPGLLGKAFSPHSGPSGEVAVRLHGGRLTHLDVCPWFAAGYWRRLHHRGRSAQPARC
jgi:hypothetical protein